jgi:lysophospholipase L1-like esterase
MGDKGLEPSTSYVIPDALHLNAKGYSIWADAMQTAIEELMK